MSLSYPLLLLPSLFISLFLTLSLSVSLKGRDLRKIYQGIYSSSQIATMCITQSIVVKRMKYNELSAFAGSFEFTSEAWKRYYEHKTEVEEKRKEEEKKININNKRKGSYNDVRMLYGIGGIEEEDEEENDNNEAEEEEEDNLFKEMLDDSGEYYSKEEDRADPKQVLRMMKTMYYKDTSFHGLTYQTTTSLGSLSSFSETPSTTSTTILHFPPTLLSVINQSMNSSLAPLVTSPFFTLPFNGGNRNPLSPPSSISLRKYTPSINISTPSAMNISSPAGKRYSTRSWEGALHEFNEMDKDLMEDYHPGRISDSVKEIANESEIILNNMKNKFKHFYKAKIKEVIKEKSKDIAELFDLNKLKEKESSIKESKKKRRDSYDSPNLLPHPSSHSFWD